MHNAHERDLGLFRRRRLAGVGALTFGAAAIGGGGWREREKRGRSRVMRKDSSGMAQSGLPSPDGARGSAVFEASRGGSKSPSEDCARTGSAAIALSSLRDSAAPDRRGLGAWPMAMTPLARLLTSTGVLRFVVVPSPSSPNPL